MAASEILMRKNLGAFTILEMLYVSNETGKKCLYEAVARPAEIA